MVKKRILVCLMIFLFTPFLFSCDESNPTHTPPPDAGGLEPAVAAQLREDYYKQQNSDDPGAVIELDEIWVREYFGTYSGCEVVFMGAHHATLGFRNIVVAGYIITFGSSQKLYVHKDSRFYTVNEAYNAGYITKEDVEAFGPEVGVDFREWKGEVFSSDGIQIITISPA